MDRKELAKISEAATKERKEQRIKNSLSYEEKIKEVQRIDASRKYTRKTPTKKEILEKENEEILKLVSGLSVIKEEPVEEVELIESEWDIPLGYPIKYFDPTLSYELTGYRPITKDKGLDFDPSVFCEAGQAYENTGKYTDYLKGTVLYKKFWRREIDRCKNGYQVGKYRITGDNYFWLNYYRLLSVTNSESNKGRTESFPTFLNKLYEYFHYIEMCRKLGKDVCALKSRGVGASEISCAIASNLYTTTSNSRSVFTTKTEVLIQPTLEKVWQELEFLNGETNGGFKHVRMKKDTDMMKRASKVDKDGREYGHMAIIEGIIADKPRKLRGRRVENLIFEEAGSFPDLKETYIQSEPLVSLLGRRIGTRMVFGTGGESGPGLAGLSDIFYKPEVYNVLPYKNYYTNDGTVAFTAFFIPAYTMWFGLSGVPGYDARGVVNEDKAKEYYISQRKKMSDDPDALIKNKAEYCWTPEEALILEGENRFNQEKLVELLANIELHKIVELPKKANLIWGFKDGQVDRDSHPKIQFEETGKILVAETPITDSDGIPYRNLYVVGIDSIDSDESTSTGQEDVSKFCCIVFRRQFGLKPPRIVATYKDRPRDVRLAYDIALKLCQYYNCLALLEATRVSLKQYWQLFNKISFLMHRPKATVNIGQRVNLKQYGVPATAAIIEHLLDLVENYVNDYCDQISFPDMLNELLKYSYVNKRKFDMVAALAMALLADEDMAGKVPQVKSVEQKELTEIGYFVNEYGLKEFGIIPKKQVEDYGWLSLRESSETYRGYLSPLF